MSDLCGEPDPGTGQTCHREGNHPTHIAGFGRKRVSWENPGWNPPPQYQPKVPDGKRKLGEIADRVEPEQRAELSDPKANLIGRIREGAGETEIDAAYAAMPNSGTQRMDVLEAIFSAGMKGMTDGEIRDAIGIRYSSGGARRGELVKGGWVIDSGARRLTSADQESIVWVVSPDGIAQLLDIDTESLIDFG